MRLKGIVDIGHRKPERARLVVIDIQTKLRRVLLPVGPNGDQSRVFAEDLKQLVTGFHQGFMAKVCAILKHEVKTRCVAQFRYRGWGERDDLRIPDLGEVS